MTYRLPAILVLIAIPILAADPPGFVYWSKGRPPVASPKGAKFENHSLAISNRDKDGAAELHENQTDIFVIQSGEATLIVGGEIVDPKKVRPGEIQGTSIKDGVKETLEAGDVVHIAAGLPHQTFIAPGKQITYFVVKVDKPSGT